MLIKIKLILILLLGVVFLSGPQLMASEEDDASSQYAVEQDKEDLTAMERMGLDGEFFLDTRIGYDNNVDLDSSRTQDCFSQSFLNVEIDKEITDKLTLRGGADIFNITYFNQNTDNLLDMVPYIGTEYFILPELRLRSEIAIEGMWYPNKKENTFYGLELRTYLRHYIFDNTYHELGYETIYHKYPDRKTYNRDSVKSDKNRLDTRHKFHYVIGTLLFNTFYAKLNNEFTINDSNDAFQEYYDYWDWRIKPSVAYFFTEQLYVYTNFSYKYRDYKDRRSTEDANKTVKDHVYTAKLSLYYDITENYTLASTYSYTENNPNDPFYKYSGSNITLGVNIVF